MTLDTTLSGLRAAVRGDVTLPDDPGYDAARAAWHLPADQVVPAVVEAADASDVAAVVRFAADAGLAVAAQCGGHGATGAASGAILLRTTRLDAVSVDPSARTARVGAGVTWGAALAATGPHDLTGLAGSAGTPGVVGYTLGGGFSWFGRAHGLASDAVRSFDVVLPDGSAARIDAASDPDLFRALRGGGGDLAVVTALEFDLFPAPHLYGGAMVFPGPKAADVLRVFREVTATAPDTVSVWYTEARFPGADPMVVVHTAVLGDGPDPHPALAPFDALGPVADSRGPLNAADLATIANEPTDPSPGLNRSELLTDLDDEAAAVVAEGPPAPLMALQIRHLGGALARPVENPGVAGPVPEPYSLAVLGAGPTPEAYAAVLAAQESYFARFGPRVAPAKPLNGMGPGQSVERALPADTLAWLRDLKRDRDPNGVIRSNIALLG